jgi:hypothetical protein
MEAIVLSASDNRRAISHGCTQAQIATGNVVSAREQNYRQLGSQICMFHVDWEIGMPVRIGYIHAKFVMTSAT